MIDNMSLCPQSILQAIATPRVFKTIFRLVFPQFFKKSIIVPLHITEDKKNNAISL